MTANPSEAGHDDLDTDPHHDALAPSYDTPDPDASTDDADGRSAAEIAEAREERDAVGGPDATDDPRPAIPPVPKWVVPAVAAVLVFLLLAFPFGWTIWAAVIGAVAAAAVSYAFVAKV